MELEKSNVTLPEKTSMVKFKFGPFEFQLQSPSSEFNKGLAILAFFGVSALGITCHRDIKVNNKKDAA